MLSEAHSISLVEQTFQPTDRQPPTPSDTLTNPSLDPGAYGANMSEHGEVEVNIPSGIYNTLPKDALAGMGSVKLFNKWSYEDVEIRDISLT